jgi:cell division septation protein DedD
MFAIRILCVAAMVLFTIGCQKKPNKSAADTANMPEIASETTTDTSKDIFNEFYDDGSGTGKTSETESAKATTTKAKKSMEETSSLPSAGGYSFSDQGPYVVQVSCVRSQSLAKKLVSQFEASGYPAYMAEVENPTPDLQGAYYRVRIGGFNGPAAARRFGNEALVPNGYDFWVDSRANDAVGLAGRGLGESNASEYSTSTPAASSLGTSSWSSSPATSTTTSTPAASSTPEYAPTTTTTTDWSTTPTTTPATSSSSTMPPATTDSDWGTTSTSTTTSTPAASSTPENTPTTTTTTDWSTTPTTTTTPSTGSAMPPATTGSDWGTDTSSSGW